MNKCDNFIGVLKSIDPTKNIRYIALARCKLWSCPYCAMRNQKKWRAKILDCISNEKNRSWSWGTITAHEKTHKHKNKIQSTLKNLSGGFSKLIKRMRRKYENDIIYVRVFEFHETGSLHLHFIVSINFGDYILRNKGKDNQYMDSRWLRKNARECGVGYMTHCGLIEPGKSFIAAGYVTKYMTKNNVGRPDFPEGFRRIQSSRHIKFTGDTTNSDLKWRISSGYFVDEMENDILTQTAVFNLTEKRAMTIDDFEGTRVYPK